MTKTLVFTPSIPSGRQGPTEFCRGRKDVVLHWNNVAQYEAIQIEQNGALLGEIPGGLSEYRDSSVPEGIYTYKVIATSGGQKSFPMSTLLSTFSPIGTFLRGDANRDGVVDVSDPVATFLTP